MNKDVKCSQYQTDSAYKTCHTDYPYQLHHQLQHQLSLFGFLAIIIIFVILGLDAFKYIQCTRNNPESSETSSLSRMHACYHSTYKSAGGVN